MTKDVYVKEGEKKDFEYCIVELKRRLDHGMLDEPDKVSVRKLIAWSPSNTCKTSLALEGYPAEALTRL